MRITKPKPKKFARSVTLLLMCKPEEDPPSFAESEERTIRLQRHHDLNAPSLQYCQCCMTTRGLRLEGYTCADIGAQSAPRPRSLEVEHPKEHVKQPSSFSMSPEQEFEQCDRRSGSGRKIYDQYQSTIGAASSHWGYYSTTFTSVVAVFSPYGLL